MEAWRDELYHHGILGQKWGKKSGPPYPLASSKHSAAEKKAGWRQSLGKSIKDYKTKKRRQKAAAKARAAKKQKEEDAKNKEKNLKNPAWLKKHAHELSNEELKAAKDRLQLENDLRSQAIRKINAGKEYADMFLGYAKTGIDAYNTVNTVIDKVNEVKGKEAAKQAKAAEDRKRQYYTDKANAMDDAEVAKAASRSKSTNTYVENMMKVGSDPPKPQSSNKPSSGENKQNSGTKGFKWKKKGKK